MQVLDPVARTVFEQGLPLSLDNHKSLTPLHRAIIARLHGQVQTYIELLDAQDAYGRTPLFYAVSASDVESIELLLKLGANPNIAETSTAVSPLHMASANGHVTIVDQLIGAPCAIQCDALNGDKESPLLVALKSCNWQCAQQLLPHSNVNLAGMKGFTPIMYAVVNPPCLPSQKATYAEFLEQMVKQGADLNAKNDAGDSVAHLAAAAGSLEALTVLHKFHSSIQKGAVNNQGRTLYHAAVEGFVSVSSTQRMARISSTMEILNALGASYLQQDHEGVSALDYPSRLVEGKRWSQAEVVALQLTRKKFELEDELLRKKRDAEVMAKQLEAEADAEDAQHKQKKKGKGKKR